MKILYIANIRLPTEKAHGIQIVKACEAFARLGHEVTLIVPKRNSPIREDPFAYFQVERNFTIVRYWTLDTVWLGKIGFLMQSITFALSARFSLPMGDVVYGRDEIVLALLAFLGVRPLVWESHDGSWNWWARFLVSRIRRLIVVSKGAQDAYIERGVSARHILAVPNGVDLEDFADPEDKEASRVRLGLPLDKKVAMYIGRLDSWKGADTLMEASNLLEDTLVAIIGGEYTQITKLSSRYPRVRFLGQRPYRELVHNQAAADVLVVPNTARDPVSVHFTSPLKLIAHMAAHRPIVASDLPSIREVIGNDAYLVTPDDPEALVMGIKQALMDTQASRMTGRAYERVTAYSWKRRAGRIVDFLKAT